MAEMMRALQDFKEVVLADDLASKRVEVAVVTFDDDVRVLQDFVRVGDWQPVTLTAQGSANVGSAIDKALDMIEARKQEYRDQGILHYRPWMIMITRGRFEGENTDTVRAMGAKIGEAEHGRRVGFFALAVADADMGLLREISVREPMRLDSFDFRRMLLWTFDRPSIVQDVITGEEPLVPPADWTEV